MSPGIEVIIEFMPSEFMPSEFKPEHV